MANLTANLDAPGVLTHHLYGVGVDTPQAFIYSSDNDFDTQPQKTFGNGKSYYNNVIETFFYFWVIPESALRQRTHPQLGFGRINITWVISLQVISFVS